MKFSSFVNSFGLSLAFSNRDINSFTLLIILFFWLWHLFSLFLYIFTIKCQSFGCMLFFLLSFIFASIRDRQKQDRPWADDSHDKAQDKHDIVHHKAIERPYKSSYRKDAITRYGDAFSIFGLVESIHLRKISYGHRDPHDSSQHFEETQHNIFVSI